MVAQKNGGETCSSSLTAAQRTHRDVQIDAGKQMLDYRSSARFRRPRVVGASADDHITDRFLRGDVVVLVQIADRQRCRAHDPAGIGFGQAGEDAQQRALDRKSTRLNSSHVAISYAVFCLKKKKKTYKDPKFVKKKKSNKVN